MSETRESKESDAQGSSKISDKLESKESDAPESSNMPNTRKRKATDEPESSNEEKKDTEPYLRNEKVQEKFFNDPVHGHIRLHPLCVKIVNTPQFQRLRFIKQLGGAYFVYPGAAHNRFEHSIGVCHLAGTFARELKNRQKEDIKFLKRRIEELGPGDCKQETVELEKEQELEADCKQKIVGLLLKLEKEQELDSDCKQEIVNLRHKLGKEQEFDAECKQEIVNLCHTLEKKQGQEIVDLRRELLRAVLRHDLNEKKKELITDQDILCVEIAGLCHDLGHGPFSHLFDGIVIPATRKEKWEHEDGSDQDFEGRPKEKHFLYQIVSNKESGIDVDKWDYFARDCLMLGMKSNFSHSRAMAFSRVIDVGAKKQICFRDKEAGNLYEMFHIRCMLHRNACHHKTTAVVEIMIADALISAIESGSEEVKYGRKANGEGYTLAEAVGNMEAFSQITDEVLMKIYHSKDETLKTAKGIAQRILTRNLYTFVGEKLFEKQPYTIEQDDKTLHDTVRKEIKAKTIELFNETVEDNIVVHLVRLNYGKNDDDPINFVRFFSKENPNKAFKLPKEKVSHFLPTIFSEQQVLVYCKDKNKETRDAVERVFKKWSDEKKTNTDKRNPTEHTDQDN